MTNNTVSFKIPSKINKICSCGETFNQVPETCRAWIDEGQLIGWVWECSCKSTLFVPSYSLKKEQEEKEFSTIISEFLHKVYKRAL